MKYLKIYLGLLLIIAISWSCKTSRSRVLPITPQEIEAHIRFLSDDLLEGRAVGSRGLAVAALYHESIFRGLGLEAAFGSSYRQPLTLNGSQPDREATLEIFSDTMSLTFEMGNQFVVTSHRYDTPQGVEGELLYCGYLIQSPEINWDDIKKTNLKGKVLLVEINEPGNYPGGIFDGEEMTYYGRWTYKFEKASELGATGILIIHNTKGAAYGWEIVQNSFSGESFFLPDKRPSLFFQGWIHKDAAEKIFKSAGFDRIQVLNQAEKREFEPLPLGLSVCVRQKPRFRSISTENVAGVLRGRHKKHRDRYIILSAHFDHLGRDSDLEEDQIFNGAVDNCSASACLLSLARFYSQKPASLKANLVFLAATAEEVGLLGSDYFVRNLPFPKSFALANLNFELTNVWGETKDVYAIGAKHSELDEFCERAAKELDFIYIPEKLGHLGYFFRSDQLSFARAGIPAVWLHEGVTSKGKDEDYILRKNEEYRKYKYHKVNDEIEEDWDLKGTVQLTRWAQEIISFLSEAEEMPRFKKTSSFRREMPETLGNQQK